MKTLYIIASPRGERSKSTELGNHVVSRIGGEVITLDLYDSFVPYITENVIAYNYGYATYENLSDADKKIADAQRLFIDQLKGANNLVIAVPMWNFNMPAILKAWVDLISKVGDTFSMDASGYKGLVKNIEQAVVVGARGGVFAGTPFAAYDMLTPHINGLLGFIWIENRANFWIEWVNATADKFEENMARVKREIDAHFAV